MITDLPPLAEIPNSARRKLLAALRGVPARGISEEELARREEKREYEEGVLADLRVKHPAPREFHRAVRAWRQNQRDLRFIQKLAALVEEQRREEELARYFEMAVLKDTPPRKLVDELGMRPTDVTYRLKCARDDIERRRSGRPTKREIAAIERRRYWAEMKASIERSRDSNTGKPRTPGRPKKAPKS